MSDLRNGAFRPMTVTARLGQAVKKGGDTVADINYQAELLQIMQTTTRIRLEELTRQLVNIVGRKVQTGPFAGMLLEGGACYSGDVSTLILGCYEAELHDAIETSIAREPDVVINVGGALGYYAVGLARRLPRAHIHVFDIQEKARMACANIAQANGVADRVSIGGRCDSAQLVELARSGKKALLVMDIDGGEIDVIDDAAVEGLKNCDIIVECHDFINKNITPTLMSRLKRHHDVSVVYEGARNPTEFKILSTLTTFERFLMVCDNRPGLQSWMICWANDPAHQQPA